MDVLVERFQRRRIVSDKSSPMLYYLRQKPKTCGTVDIDVLAASIQKNCAMTKGDVKHVIEALVEEIQANLANGDKVQLSGFGTFETKTREARVGRNPRTKEPMVIPATRVPTFKASKALRDTISK